MRGVIPQLRPTFSWCGAYLKHRDNFTFTLQTGRWGISLPPRPDQLRGSLSPLYNVTGGKAAEALSSLFTSI